MFYSPILSSKDSVADRHSVASRVACPTQPKIYRDPYGRLKYSVDVDLSGFPGENIRVTNVRNIVTIDAKYVNVDELGDECTHELRREIHLPSNVNPNTVTCLLNSDGILTIEADANEFKQDTLIQSPLSPVLPARMNRLFTSNYFKSPSQLVNQPSALFSPVLGRNRLQRGSPDPRRITFNDPVNVSQTTGRSNRGSQIYQQYFFAESPKKSRASLSKIGSPSGTESILKSSPFQRSSKNVRVVLPPGSSHVVESENVRPTWMRGSSASPERFNQRQQYQFNSSDKSKPPNSPYKTNCYTLRVEVGSYFRPGDLSVSVKNGVVIICAKRFMDESHPRNISNQSSRMIYEHQSEHTLPAEVNPAELKCHFENGVVFLDAPLRGAPKSNLTVTTPNLGFTPKQFTANSFERAPSTLRSTPFSPRRVRKM